MARKNYIYYQPNKLDLKDEYGDCTIRALSKCFDCTWKEAFEMTIPLSIKYQCLCFGRRSYKDDGYFTDMGLEWHGVSVHKGEKRPTVAEFARRTRGDGKRYIAVVAHHVVGVCDGYYYDTWDSGNKPMYGWYERV